MGHAYDGMCDSICREKRSDSEMFGLLKFEVNISVRIIVLREVLLLVRTRPRGR